LRWSGWFLTGEAGPALNIYPAADGVQHSEVAGMRDTLDAYAAKGTRGHTVTLKVKFADFELISRSRTVAGAIGSCSKLELAASDLLRALFPLKKAVRLLGVSISSFSSEDTKQIGLAL